MTLLAGGASADHAPGHQGGHGGTSGHGARASGVPVPPAVAAAPERRRHWQPRPEQYHATATTTDLAIPMDDGVVLRGDLVRPVRADGTVVTRPLPVIITITA